MRRLQGIVGRAFCWIAAAIAIAVCFGMIAYLVQQGLHALNIGFFLDDPNPTLIENQGGGIRSPIAGTIILAVLGTVFMMPPALGASIYLAEYMNEDWALTRAIRLGLEVLAGVPSVVFGMFGLAMFTLPLLSFLSGSAGESASAALGRSFIIGSLVMALHILPFCVKVMEEAIRSVPESYRAGAAALGMTRWRTVRKVILPAAAPGLITAVVLGLGIIVGDTAIVILAVGASVEISGATQWWLPWNWLPALLGGGPTLTTFIYNMSPAGEYNSPMLAYGAALVLIVIVLALNLAIAFIGRARNVQQS
jgi:phosphate transport system permease protein